MKKLEAYQWKQKGILKLIELKEKFGGMMSTVMAQNGGQANPEEIQKKISLNVILVPGTMKYDETAKTNNVTEK